MPRGGAIGEGRALAADRTPGAHTGGPVGWKRCTSLLGFVFCCRFPKGRVSVWRWAAISCVPGSRGPIQQVSPRLPPLGRNQISPPSEVHWPVLRVAPSLIVIGRIMRLTRGIGGPAIQAQ